MRFRDGKGLAMSQRAQLVIGAILGVGGLVLLSIAGG
jgi:hypothetical protein